MQGPFFRHLTNAYVEFLGLEKFSTTCGTFTAAFISENAAKPVSLAFFDLCVVYNHGLYRRAPDGLSWDLQP